MKGCGRAVLISLLWLVAIIAAIAAGLNRWYGVALTGGIVVSIFGGLFAWIAAKLLISAGTALRERATVRAGMAGAAPVDGRTILVGHIEPNGPPLTAPLSGRSCVAYAFEIYEMRRSGKSSSKVVLGDGVALTPSLIVTPAGSFRLLAVPELVCDETPLDREAALLRVQAWMRTAPVAPQREAFSTPPIEAQWNDDDGAFQREERHVEGHHDLERVRLSERAIERGAQVCVFGQYSSAKRAIVANPNDWSKITRVMKGDAHAVARRLGWSVVRRTLGALIFAAAAIATVTLFVESLA